MAGKPDSETFPVWVTSYCLTRGILYYPVATFYPSFDMVEVLSPSGVRLNFHGKGRQWHRSLESAVNRAEAMLDRRVRALKKELTRLEKGEPFKVVTP